MRTSARNLVKNFAEAALVRTGVTRAARRRLRGRILVLAYHNIVPTGELFAGELSLHLSQRDFGRQLDLISSTHDVVRLESVIDDLPDSARPRIAITFDDAYHGAITAGLEELRRRSMPATVFVAPGLLARDTWWDRLAESSGGTMTEAVRRHAIEVLGGDHDRVLAWFEASGERGITSPLPRIATEIELETASRQPGIAFASHTWSHRNLRVLNANELDCELAPSRAWLRSRFANAIDWLSYPYGLSSPNVERMAEQAGYIGAFRVSGGWLRRHPDLPFALSRLGIPNGLSSHGFILRLAGIGANR